MAHKMAAALRTARMQALVDFAGANCKMKFYNGTQPATGGGALSGNTLLATLNFVSLGTVANGVLTLGAATQNNANHVNGTPTWVRITKSDDNFVDDLAIPADLTFTGTIATGVDVTSSGTLTEGNPA